MVSSGLRSWTAACRQPSRFPPIRDRMNYSIRRIRLIFLVRSIFLRSHTIQDCNEKQFDHYFHHNCEQTVHNLLLNKRKIQVLSLYEWMIDRENFYLVCRKVRDVVVNNEYVWYVVHSKLQLQLAIVVQKTMIRHGNHLVHLNRRESFLDERSNPSKQNLRRRKNNFNPL